MAEQSGQLNCRVVPVEVPAPREGSFTIFGHSLGPGVDHPSLAEYANSPHVDMKREYEYPLYYASLKVWAISSVVSFALVFFFSDPDLIKSSVVFAVMGVIGSVGLIVGGIRFGVRSLCWFMWRPASPPQPLSRNELRHLLGTTACTFWTFMLILIGTLKHYVGGKSGYKLLDAELFCIELAGALVVLVPSWYLVNSCSQKPVKAGIIASMFWSGAIFSTELAGIFNTLLLQFWKSVDEDCSADLPLGPRWPIEAPSGGCIGKAWVEWIFTPGIVEESLKFVVLVRLVTTVEEATKSMVMTRCPRMSTSSWMPCCGWFPKLAASPAVVVLCGMAAGGGFGTLENVQYIAKLSGLVEETGDILPATVRVFTAIMHIAMTGTCAFGLAVALFQNRWYMKYSGWIIMVIGHGTYDAFCTFDSELPITSCYTRAHCYKDSVGEITCDFTLDGPLQQCYCPSTIDEKSRRCAPTPGLEDLLPVPGNISEALRANNTLRSRNKLAGHGDFGDTLIYCPSKSPEQYVCGPKYVEWWPTGLNWVLGFGIVIFFFFLASCILPCLEKSFNQRQTTAFLQTGAAAPPVEGSQVQLA